jgi:foldase protein PrsA
MSKWTKFLSDKKKLFKKYSKGKGKVYGFVVILLVIAYFSRGLFIAAFVNGQPISRLSVVAELERRGGAEVLDTLITQALISQEAKRSNVTVTQQELEITIAEIEASLEGQGGLDQLLLAEGMTREDLERQIRLQKLTEKILADKITVTDEEVVEYLENNADFLPEDATDEELKVLARNQLEQQKLSSEIQVWLSELRDNSNINYFVDY